MSLVDHVSQHVNVFFYFYFFVHVYFCLIKDGYRKDIITMCLYRVVYKGMVLFMS